MSEFVLMYPCIECGEDVDARECYDDLGTLMHSMGVTGQAEPHETGSGRDDLKQVDVQSFANPNPTPDFRPLVVRDVAAYLMETFGLSEPQAKAHTEAMLNNALRQMGEPK